MKVELDSQNYVILHPASGRIQELHLSGKTIISHVEEGLGSGNFLMYPWVNRVQQNPLSVKGTYFDGNGLPLHGLYVDDVRKISVSKIAINQDTILIELIPTSIIQGVAQFKEHYLLQKNSVRVSLQVMNPQIATLPFCFGYHPYLQIDNQQVKELHLTTNIQHQLQLQQSLLPIFPYVKSEVTITSHGKYDSLFEGGTFLRLQSKQGFNVQIRSQMPYWQIYTPPDGIRIAVEPMSFTANVYKISQSGFKPNLLKGSFSISAWQQKQP